MLGRTKIMKTEYTINDLDLLTIGCWLKKILKENENDVKHGKIYSKETKKFLMNEIKSLKKEVKKIFNIYYSKDYYFTGV